jgi:DNA-binding NarL/FixJ family response regulator
MQAGILHAKGMSNAGTDCPFIDNRSGGSDRDSDPGEAFRHRGLRNVAVTRVMVVEDSDIVRAVTRQFLADIPGLCLTGEFCCASTAIDGIRYDPPEVLLLDIQLHAGNGMDVLNAMSVEHPATKVIIVTNYADEVYRRRYTDAGAYGFYDKCRELDALRLSLEQLAGDAAGATASPRAILVSGAGCRHNSN